MPIEKMQRVVIDTNVLVSALIQKSFPYKILNDLFLEDLIEVCISDELYQEYYEVLQRDKFSKYPAFKNTAEALLPLIKLKARLFAPQNKIDLLSDKDDNKLLELCLQAKADYLITGDMNDFTIKEFKGTKIVSPSEYWDEHRPV